MKKVPLYAKHISISSNNAEGLENLTDPNLHNAPINNLHLSLKNFNISSKTIENLQSLYPKLITLNQDPKTRNEYSKQVLFENFTKLLPKLDPTSLEMNFNKYDYRIKLEFSDVTCKVMESKEECSYIRTKSVEIRCSDEEFCWIK